MKRYQNITGNLFRGERFSDLLDQKTALIESDINGEQENYILNVNENTYIDAIESQYTLELPLIHFDKAYLDQYEAEVPVEYLPEYARHGRRDEYFTHEVYQLFIPIEGKTEVLKYRLNTVISGNWGEFRIDYSHLLMDYLTFSTNADEIKRHFDSAIDGLKTMFGYLEVEVANYNNNLREIVKYKFYCCPVKLLL